MRRFAFVFVLLGLTAPLDALAGTSNSLMDISADGQLLACTNRDNGTVSLVDLQSNTVIRETSMPVLMCSTNRTALSPTATAAAFT